MNQQNKATQPAKQNQNITRQQGLLAKRVGLPPQLLKILAYMEYSYLNKSYRGLLTRTKTNNINFNVEITCDMHSALSIIAEMIDGSLESTLCSTSSNKDNLCPITKNT